MWAVPNPFVGGTTVSYRMLPGAIEDHVSVAVYDMAGRLVRGLRDSSAGGASGMIRWDDTDDAGRALPSGIYLLRLPVDGRMVMERVARIR